MMRSMRPIGSFVILFCGLLTVSCQKNAPPAPRSAPLPPVTAPVLPAGKDVGRDLLGQVQADPQATSQSMARLSALSVLSIAHFPGDRVKKGETIMVLQSPDFFSAESELSSILSSPGGGDVPGIRRLAIRRLVLLGASQKEISRLTRTRTPTDRYEARSPRSGILTRLGPGEGARVSTGDLLFVVSDLDRLWVRAFLYPGEEKGLSDGVRVRVSPLDDPSRVVEGSILRVAPYIDPRTRTIPLRIVIDNALGLFRPDAWVRVRIPVRPQEGASLFRVPGDAVVRRMDGKTGVFVVRPPGGIRFLPVSVLGRGKGEAVVSGEFLTGDRVVTRGLLPLVSRENGRMGARS